MGQHALSDRLNSHNPNCRSHYQSYCNDNNQRQRGLIWLLYLLQVRAFFALCHIGQISCGVFPDLFDCRIGIGILAGYSGIVNNKVFIE